VEAAKTHALKKLMKAAKRARLGERAGADSDVPGLTIILGMGRPEQVEEETEEVEFESEDEEEEEEE
jgi:hypothetical protein